MQTNEDVLSKFKEDLKLRNISTDTQKQYLCLARLFLEWSKKETDKLDEKDIKEYLDYLTNIRKLSASSVNVRNVVTRLLLGTITGDEKFCSAPRVKPIKSGYLENDKKAFIHYLVEMDYDEKNLRNYKWTINCLERFMHEHKKPKYSRNVGEAFLSEFAKSELHTPGVLEMMGYIIRRFTCFMEQGEYILVMPRLSKESPSQFVKELAKYLDYCRKRGLRESTIERKRCNIQKALLKFDAAGLKSFSDIKAEAIYDAFEKTSDKTNLCSPLRGFLRYLFETGVIKFDYSAYVPSVRKARPIPSIYTAAETEELLENTEATAKSSKRNNAIILLALRLGIRSGDISNLKITDFDFNSKTINFVQEKTHVPQHLELLPEIEEAILSYISMVRPVSDIPNVFLSVKAPIRPITAKSIYSFINHRFETSDIDTGDRKRGGHALRMTLASELVAEKVPYDAVRKILGHDDPVSIKHYVGFDIESLRSCAIGVPSVTGKLAAYMEMRLGGSVQ